MTLRAVARITNPSASVLVTAPSLEPVGVQEVKTQLNLDTSDDNILIQDFITMAREEIERRTNIAMITQSWRLVMDRWPAGLEPWWDGVRQGSLASLYGPNAHRALEIPHWPLQSITSLTTYDESSNSTAVTVATVFDVDTYSRPGRLSLKSGQVWPTATRPVNAIDMVYVAGYGANGTYVPAPIKRAVRQMAAWLYSHRGDECDPSSAYSDSGAEAIMNQYAIPRL